MRLCLKEMIPIAKKRKNGEGTLRLRKDGRWEGRIVTDYREDGRPITKNVTAKTKTECCEKLEKLKERYGRHTDKIKSDMPFGDWIDFWYQTYCRHTLRITTRTDYENRIFNHIISEIGKISLNRLSQSDLQQFYAKEKTDGRKLHAKTYGKGLSDRTIRGIHANCRRKKRGRCRCSRKMKLSDFCIRQRKRDIMSFFCWSSARECGAVKYWRSNGATSTSQQESFALNGRYISSRQR